MLSNPGNLSTKEKVENCSANLERGAKAGRHYLTCLTRVPHESMVSKPSSSFSISVGMSTGSRARARSLSLDIVFVIWFSNLNHVFLL